MTEKPDSRSQPDDQGGGSPLPEWALPHGKERECNNGNDEQCQGMPILLRVVAPAKRWRPHPSFAGPCRESARSCLPFAHHSAGQGLVEVSLPSLRIRQLTVACVYASPSFSEPTDSPNSHQPLRARAEMLRTGSLSGRRYPPSLGNRDGREGLPLDQRTDRNGAPAIAHARAMRGYVRRGPVGQADERNRALGRPIWITSPENSICMTLHLRHLSRAADAARAVV